jgi:hypothetical protein
MRRPRSACCLAACALWACSDAKEAERVELRVVTDGAALTRVTSDLGYVVELASASVAASELKFTIAGEVHAGAGRWLSDRLIRAAHAHPGHFQGGEVTGELPGSFILRFAPGEVHELGFATLLVGTYKSANLTLAYADDTQVEGGESLVGHTAALHGTATREGADVEFEILLDSPAGRELVGIPFEQRISLNTRDVLTLRLSPLDPREMDTLFDGVDFDTLDDDADGRVRIAPEASDDATLAAYNAIRRRFQTHDHFVVQAQR